MSLIRTLIIYIFFVGSACVSITFVFAQSNLPAQTESPSLAIKVAITDINIGDFVVDNLPSFQRKLTETLKKETQVITATNKDLLINALNEQKIDLVICSPADYVVLRRRTNSYPILTLTRSEQFSSVIVLNGLGINTLKDLTGRRIAMGEAGKTVTHLAAAQLFKDQGIDPNKDIKIGFGKPIMAWNALKSGEVDAVVLNNDYFTDLRAADRDYRPSDFKVIARTGDLPSDIILANTSLSSTTVDMIKRALVLNSEELIRSLLGKERNKERFRGISISLRVDDRNYDTIRQMYKTIGHPEYSKFISPG